MAFSRAILFSVLVATAYAANDWSKPCFDGDCSYELPKAKSGEQSAVGAIRIWGAKGAIGDITNAAGWEVIGCSPSALSQDIRLVCKSDDAEAACNHLYENGGPVDKIIRLPDNCGASAFARVSRAWVPEDQSVPSEIARKINRRAGVVPQVKAISIDTNFAAADPSKNGPVYIAIQGMNAPGYENTLDTIPLPQLMSASTSKRGFWDWVGDVIDSFNEFDLEKSTSLPPIDINKQYTLFDKSVTCGPVSASIRVDAEARAHAVVDIGIVAAGTIIPPDLDNLYVFAGLNADLNGRLTLNAQATGDVTTGDVTIYEVGIPGLDFPGILQIGPAFKVNALARANLDVKLNVDVGLDYQIRNARLVFPPGAANSGGNFAPADTPLKLSVSPSVTANGIVEANIKPQLDIGLEAFSLVEAHVFLNLDAHASLDLSLTAGAHIGNGVNPVFTDIKVLPTAVSPVYTGIKTLPTGVIAIPKSPIVTKSPVLNLPKQEVKAEARRAFPRRHLAVLDARDEEVTTEAVETYFNGCIGMQAGLSVNAGADANFLGLFDKNTSVTLFKRDFQLFQKCWGAGVSAVPKRSLVLESRGLTCAASSVGNAVEAVNSVVKAADIRAI